MRRAEIRSTLHWKQRTRPRHANAFVETLRLAIRSPCVLLETFSGQEASREGRPTSFAATLHSRYRSPKEGAPIPPVLLVISVQERLAKASDNSPMA